MHQSQSLEIAAYAVPDKVRLGAHEGKNLPLGVAQGSRHP